MMVEPLLLYSTNQASFGPDLEERVLRGGLETVGFAEAIFRGQAPDGGLYVPIRFPQVTRDEQAAFKKMTYGQVFAVIAGKYLQGVLERSTTQRIGSEIFDNPVDGFEPFIEPISDIDFISRLDEGPSFAFKDYAKPLSRFMEAIISEEPKTEIEFRRGLRLIELFSILTTTSGDTGSAMGDAFHNINRMWNMIYYSNQPGQVSPLQAKLMDTIGGNIVTRRLETDFNGCSSIASELQHDEDLTYMHMNSANSVNIGRIISQIAYYFFIKSRVTEPDEHAKFSVPCGNLGNLTSGAYAMSMGLNATFIAALNENRAFKDYMENGVYRPSAETILCDSNSMNVQNPSNARRLANLYGGQIILVKHPTDPTRYIVLSQKPADFERMRKDITPYSISNKLSRETSDRFFDEKHTIEYKGGDIISTLEPHGAVAWAAANAFRHDTDYRGKMIVLETAHAAKFLDAIRKDRRSEVIIPARMQKLLTMPDVDVPVLPANYEVVKRDLINQYEAKLKVQRARH